MRGAWKVSNGLMAALFLFSAALQYNDPEPWRWAAIYVAAAVPCVVALRRTPSWIMPAAVLAWSLIWVSFYVQRNAWSVPLSEAFATWKMQNQQMLEKREMTGLLIVIGWMVVMIIAALANRRRRLAGQER
jgi:hypothetical protein